MKAVKPKPTREPGSDQLSPGQKKINQSRKPSEPLDTASCSGVKVLLRQIRVVSTANDRQHADLVCWMLMIVFSKWWIHRACSAAWLSSAAPVEACVHACTCRAALPPCHGCPLQVQLKDQRTAGDGWLSTRVFQVFGEHSTLSVSFVTQKNHRALSVPLHLSSLRKNSQRPVDPATALALH